MKKIKDFIRIKKNNHDTGKGLFSLYKEGLSPDEAKELSLYESDLSQHILLPKKEKNAIIDDFHNAFLYYQKVGVPFAEVLSRLDPANLGGFYARPPVKWYPLDTASKVYPLSMTHERMTMFRLAAYLKEDVVPELLQMALTFTVKRFPSFATSVNNGFFWHYLNALKTRYAVCEEKDTPCQPIKFTESNIASFRVLYFGKRISVEFFHSLTDATGGMEFLKVLLREYLRLCGTSVPDSDLVMNISDEPSEEETENSFLRAEKAEKISGFIDKPAVQLSGRISYYHPCRILHFKMNAEKLHSAAKERGATVTAYILSRMFMAGRYATDEAKGQMNIQVPFNMRKYCPSKTVRHFSLYCGIKFDIKTLAEAKSADDLIPEITKQLKERTSREAMREMTSSALRIVSSVKFVPKFIKAPFVAIGYGILGESVWTNTLSNIGVVELPKEMEEKISSMDFVLGTVLKNRTSAALVTASGITTLSISKNTIDPSFEEKMYEMLKNDGNDIIVEGSEVYEM